MRQVGHEAEQIAQTQELGLICQMLSERRPDEMRQGRRDLGQGLHEQTRSSQPPGIW